MTREQICASASAKLHKAEPTLNTIPALIGLDGFVDEIVAVVDKRTGLHDYVPVKTIAHLAEKIHKASGQSSNYELIVKQMKLGGNGPIMANALASAGLAVTYIGNLGYPSLHSVFEPFAKRANVISIAEPGHTDALEFDDGKLMLGKIEPVKDINWDNLLGRVGQTKLETLFGQSVLVGMVNWTMLPFMSEIWAKLMTDVLPKLPKQKRTLFVDLADPEKRLHEDIAQAMKLLTEFQKQIDVILGLNLKESTEILAVLDLPTPADPEAEIQRSAAAIRQKLGIGCVVIHPRRGAAAATAETNAAFAGPFVQQPKISTGAGDHFNAGFCLGRILGMDLAESLCIGVATSGYYVRNAASPTAAELADFVSHLPPPQA
ncbi:MAG TPA: PfkB family carbohydrate kinase [Tepidisphaeraceae bacterium]|nr:PfkB family carbohydrate kinase [Tepidisphaeraceae bacterium]